MICSLRLILKGCNTAQIRLAVLIIVVLQALGLGSAWPQEPVQPRIDEEIVKQEKIYAAGAPRFPAATSRVEPCSSTGCSSLRLLRSLASLGSSDRWLDIGAGDGQAILDYYAPGTTPSLGKTCAVTSGRVRAVAMSIEDRRTDKWHRVAASLGKDRIRYVSGKRLREYSSRGAWKFQIITDVYGGFSYTEDLSLFMDKVLSSSSRRRLLHVRAKRAFGKRQGQRRHSLSD